MRHTTDEPVPPVATMEEFFAQAGQGANGAPLSVGPLASAASSGILLAVAGTPPGRPGPTPADAGPRALVHQRALPAGSGSGRAGAIAGRSVSARVPAVVCRVSVAGSCSFAGRA